MFNQINAPDAARKKHRIEQAIAPIVNAPASPTDPSGSYTGKPVNKNERPVQDADDL